MTCEKCGSETIMGHGGPRRFCSEVCKNKWYHDRKLREKISTSVAQDKLGEIGTSVKELVRLGFVVRIT